MSFLRRLLTKHLDILLLTSILVFLCLKNYTPDTWLIGWDNLIPELNIWLNLKRSFLAVWQEYQGLGLVGGMGHATDLIRQLIILPLTLILPNSIIRYLWHFTMLFLGTFGIYLGLKNQLKFSKTIAFFSSLFYLLNFGSIQYFWVAFEPFSTFWGFFPWLIFSLWQYLKNPSSKKLKRLLILNFLAIPSFYVQTIFIVYFLCLGSILIPHLIVKAKKNTTKRSFNLIAFILLINAFWLLPSIYFFITDRDNTRQAFGNLMATQETVDRNQYRGTLSDFVLLRGFYYDFPSNLSLMAPWHQHFANSYFLIPGFILFLFVFIGLLHLILKRSKKLPSLSLICLFFVSAIPLLSATPLFSQLNSVFRQIPLLNQVFRSPWTKFLVPIAFSFSLLTAYGLQAITKLIKLLRYNHKKSSIVLFSCYTLLITVFTFPVFKGYYFSPHLRQKLPSEYSQLVEFFKTQPKTARITNLPSGNFWGWTNYRFGINGSGFLWYGIEQPIMDRAFDVWSLKNETYYRELDLALQKRNPHLLASVFKKYSIELLILDQNIFFPNDLNYAKLSLDTPQLLSQIPNLKLLKKFGQISVYQTGNYTKPYQTNSLPQSSFSLKPNTDNFLFHQKLIRHQYFTDIEHSQLTLPFQTRIDNFIRLQNKTDTRLISFIIPDVGFNQSYLLKITHRHLSGYPLKLAILQQNNHFKFTETILKNSPDWQESLFFIPKMENSNFYPGLNLLFINSSFNPQVCINDIKSITTYSYPSQDNIPSTSTGQQLMNKSNSNIFYYKINIDPKTPNYPYLTLPQSFHRGWLAFHFKGIKPIPLKNHTLSNNWANAWQIDQNIPNTTSIYILFWPQLLQFLGFALLIPVTIYITKKKP